MHKSVLSKKAGMKDINDLVRFIYNYTIHGTEEYIEYDARLAESEEKND